MKSSLMHFVPPVSRDRIISQFPKWYTPEACLQLKEHFHTQVSTACQHSTATAGLKISKVVVVGDLYVGKTSLINRFCKDNFDRDYKATIGVDFEMERFEIIGIPYHLQIWDTAGQEKFKCIASAYYRGAEVIITVFDLADIQTLDHTKQWLEDALRENEPDSSFVFLVGTKKDLVGQCVRYSGTGKISSLVEYDIIVGRTAYNALSIPFSVLYFSSCSYQYLVFKDFKRNLFHLLFN
ncbi:PREDICTED: ras-related protein Rab-36 isoform X2 [Lepidothrix coronata]|uniref:Ras-related protein Rab-36 n=1 Tax=Lepidothrix coronata TaxID=321398 RepID=A0A6J0H678_9PASS|nr:PREDICTED: ras-related protein Rab-36 isoform X2 [Lepidothrix coronata]